MGKICQKRSLAWILSFLLVFTSVPYEAFANENVKAANAQEGATKERTTDEGNDAEIESPAPEKEIVEERTENAKVFDNGDGTFTKNIYFDPIHIEENGEFTNDWQKARYFNAGMNARNIGLKKKSALVFIF